MSNPSPPAPQRDTFVGRVRELAEFRNSMRYLLGKEPPPTGSPYYPHIFLPHGEGGMGKSALLRQFLRIAREEGLADERIIVIDLDYHGFPTADALGRMLAERIGERHPGFDRRYRAARARRDELAERYRELERQWVRWEALRGSDDGDIDELLDAHRRTFRRTEIQRADFGDLYAPPHLFAQIDRATDELAALLAFRDECGHAPRSFDELLQRELGADAALFGAASGLGQALAEDLYELAERDPLLLALDTYERADEHDDWLRTTILATSSDRMLTIIAGRNRHDADSRRTFSGEFANLVRSYNLNDQALQPDEVRQYLALRLKQDDPPDELVAEVHAISRGIPLALDALGDQLAGGGDLTPYREMELKDLHRRAVVHAVTERFLRYALNDKGDDQVTRDRKRRDRQRIRALALLLQPDAELACALWGVPMEQGQAIVEDLAERHSFIFAGYSPYEMHDLVYEFVREDVQAEKRNSFDWSALEAGLRRVLIIIERRIAQIERNIVDPDERYKHPGWWAAILDKLNALLWLGEEDVARRLLLNRWVEVLYANALFADDLASIVAELAPKTPEWERIVDMVCNMWVNISSIPELVDKLPQNIDAEIRLLRYNKALLESFTPMLEKHVHAMLCYLNTRYLWMDGIKKVSYLEHLNSRITLFRKGYKLDKTWKPLRVELARTYLERGVYNANVQKDFKEALADFERSMKLQPDDPDTFNNRGAAKIELEGDWTSALADFQQSLVLRPDNPGALSNRGVAKRHLGDPKGAMVDFERSLALQPDDPHTYNNRGAARHDLGNYRGALADYNRSLELQPNDPNILANRGKVKSLLGDFAGALADFEQSLALWPNHPATLANRAGAKSELADHTGALADFEQSLALQPNHPDLFVNRGLVKSKLGDYTGALADYDRAVELRPNDSKALNNRGYLYAKIGQFEKAIIDLQTAIVINSHAPMTYCSLAETYILMNDYDTAITWLAKAIDLDSHMRRHAAAYPDYDPIRADPRFIALVGDPEPRTGNDGTAEATE